MSINVKNETAKVLATGLSNGVHDSNNTPNTVETMLLSSPLLDHHPIDSN